MIFSMRRNLLANVTLCLWMVSDFCAAKPRQALAYDAAQRLHMADAAV